MVARKTHGIMNSRLTWCGLRWGHDTNVATSTTPTCKNCLREKHKYDPVEPASVRPHEGGAE